MYIFGCLPMKRKSIITLRSKKIFYSVSKIKNSYSSFSYVTNFLVETPRDKKQSLIVFA